MATRQTFAKKIADRARRIGWEVNMMSSTGGWEIKSPKGGTPVTIHLTPSDRNAEKNVMQQLNRLGFEEAEREWEQQTEDERKARIRADQERNQALLDRKQREAEAVSRASGQNRIDRKVLLTPCPMPKTFERVLVTPELANDLLDLNTSNRPIRQREVALWNTIIQNGEWRYTHQGIAIDSNGILQDGQHRLTAVVQTEVPVEMQISIGMPPENFAAIDNGLRRTFGDVVAGHGIGNRNRVGTAARLLIIYNSWPERASNDKVLNTEIDLLLRQPYDDEQNYGSVLYQAVMRSHLLWTAFRINANGAAVGIFKLWEAFGMDDPKVNEFLEGLRSGENLQAHDARFVLRRLMLSPAFRERSAWHHLALFLKCWNKWLQGAHVQLLTFRKGEEFPQVMQLEEDTE